MEYWESNWFLLVKRNQELLNPDVYYMLKGSDERIHKFVINDLHQIRSNTHKIYYAQSWTTENSWPEFLLKKDGKCKDVAKNI